MQTIEIEATKIGSSGVRYAVTWRGEVIVEGSKYPEHDAARALLAKGVPGEMQTKWKGSDVICLTMDIEHAAGRTVTEGNKGGLKACKWHPHPHANDAIPADVGDATDSNTPTRPLPYPKDQIAA